MTQSHTPAVEALPVVAWRSKQSGVTYLVQVQERGIHEYPWVKEWSPLTPHAPAQAQIDALRIENERMRDRLMMLRNHTSVSENQIAMIDDALKAGKDHGHE